MMQKKLFVNLGLSVVSVVVLVGVLVGVDRLLGLWLNRMGYFKGMVPNVTVVSETNEFSAVATISAQGLRNPLVVATKPEGLFRILTVGDSFTFGWGVAEDKAWPRVLERELVAKGYRVEVINAGIPGVGLRRVRWACRAYKEQFDVDAVIVGAHTDDLVQAAAAEEQEKQWWQMVKDLFPTLTRLGEEIIDDNSTLSEETAGTVIVTQPIWKQRVAADLKGNPRLLLGLDPTLRSDYLAGKVSPDLVNRARLKPDFFTFLLREKEMGFALEATRERFEKLHHRCTKDLPAAAIFLPSGSLVSAYYHPFRKVGYEVEARLTQIELDISLKELTEPYGFTYVPTLKDFRQGCLDCFFPYDGHFTARGHELTAQLLLPVVEEWLTAK